MDFIYKNLNKNKVNVEIKTNDFCETVGLTSSSPPQSSLDKLSDIWKSYAENTKNCNDSSVEGIDSLIFIMLCEINPVINDLNQSEKLIKVRNFQNNLVDNLDNEKQLYKHFNLKSSHISIDKLKREVLQDKGNRYGLLTYFSKLLNQNIYYLDWCCTGRDGEDITLAKDSYDKWIIKSRVENKKNIEEKKKKYIDSDLRKNFKNLLVVDLRTIAIDLNIPIKHHLDNKIKFYTKNQLKSRILDCIYDKASIEQ